MEHLKLSHIVGGKRKLYSHFGNKFGSFFVKLNIYLPHDAAIPHLGIYPREIKHMPGKDLL